jgi:hypothetical protein
MRIATETDVAVFRGKSQIFFASWLYKGLREYLFEKKGRYAFPGAENFIEQQEDISLDIAEIVKALSEADSDTFKKASVAVFRAMKLDTATEIGIGKEILRICAHLNASDIVGVLKQKESELKSNSIDPGFYDLVKEVVRDMS